MEGEKFKLRICLRLTSSLLSVLLRTRSAQGLSSQHLVAVLTPNLAELVPSGFFLSTTMVFAAVRTHFRKKKHPYLSQHSNLRSSRNIESSRRTSLEFAAFGNGLDFKHSRASAFVVFSVYNHDFCSGPNTFPQEKHSYICQSSCDQ